VVPLMAAGQGQLRLKIYAMYYGGNLSGGLTS